MARHFSFRPSFTLRGREFYGIRGWAGKPIHPMFTDFPIVGYVLAATFTLIAFFGQRHDAYIASTWVMAAAFMISVITATTGALDWPATTRGTQARRTVNAHASIMVTATLLALATLIARFLHLAPSGRWFAAITALTCLVGLLVAIGMWIGNDLVFEHGFRVEPSRNTPAWDPSEEDILPGGQALDPQRWHWAAARANGHSNGVAKQGAQPMVRVPVSADGPKWDVPRAADGNGEAVPSKLRELWKLRDEGLITTSDYESKKRELLTRI